MSTQARTMFAYTVGQLLTYLRELLESDGYLSDVWVSGEVVNLTRSQAGHCYFSLRDDAGVLRCVLFARQAAMVRTRLQNGERVLVHGRVALYEQRGDLQLIADFVRPEGVGVEQARLDQLTARLEADGLFDLTRKRALPRFPRRIGVITSPHGAVFHDICHVLERRWPLAEILLAETPVQGDGAFTGIPYAFSRLNRITSIDVVILARGGGGADELAVFNDEVIARAIFGSAAPVVSAVGHETNTTIADLVADVRAPTPSAAAELVVPDQRDVLASVERQALGLNTSVATAIARRQTAIDLDARRLERGLPSLAAVRSAVDAGERAMARAVGARMEMLGAMLTNADGRLAALSPMATLSRGYAIVQREKDGSVLTRAEDTQAHDTLGIRLADGEVRAEVIE